jgi:hypothetical protein
LQGRVCTLQSDADMWHCRQKLEGGLGWKRLRVQSQGYLHCQTRLPHCALIRLHPCLRALTRSELAGWLAGCCRLPASSVLWLAVLCHPIVRVTCTQGMRVRAMNSTDMRASAANYAGVERLACCMLLTAIQVPHLRILLGCWPLLSCRRSSLWCGRCRPSIPTSRAFQRQGHDSGSTCALLVRASWLGCYGIQPGPEHTACVWCVPCVVCMHVAFASACARQQQRFSALWAGRGLREVTG